MRSWNPTERMDEALSHSLEHGSHGFPSGVRRLGHHEADRQVDRYGIQGVAISGPLMGQRLTPVADSFVAFWFAWSLYYPSIRVHS